MEGWSHYVCGSMPHMSDAARKRYVADWVVKIKRQVVKLYAIAKWSRDASVVQKAMVHTLLLIMKSSTHSGRSEHHGVPHGPESAI